MSDFRHFGHLDINTYIGETISKEIIKICFCNQSFASVFKLKKFCTDWKRLNNLVSSSANDMSDTFHWAQEGRTFKRLQHPEAKKKAPR
jgi:hypothetical protein